LSVSNSSETRKLPTTSNPSLACLVTEYLHFRDKFCPTVFKIFLVVVRPLLEDAWSVEWSRSLVFLFFVGIFSNVTKKINY
jgi:hypothetical protein